MIYFKKKRFGKNSSCFKNTLHIRKESGIAKMILNNNIYSYTVGFEYVDLTFSLQVLCNESSNMNIAHSSL